MDPRISARKGRHRTAQGIALGALMETGFPPLQCFSQLRCGASERNAGIFCVRASSYYVAAGGDRLPSGASCPTFSVVREAAIASLATGSPGLRPGDT